MVEGMGEVGWRQLGDEAEAEGVFLPDEGDVLLASRTKTTLRTMCREREADND